MSGKRSKSQGVTALTDGGGLLVMFKSDNDFYNLLSAAMEYDSSFGDEKLLNFQLEEGRFFYNRRNNNNNNNNNKGGGNNINHEKGKDDFEKAILILDEYKSRNSFLSLLDTLSLFPWRLKQRNKGRPTQAITPSILSGLCSLARTNDSSSSNSYSTADDNVRQQQQHSSRSPDKITVSSSDLVLFCEGLQGQALRQLRRRRRQKRFLLPAIIFLAIVIGLNRFSTVLVNIDEGMEKIRYHRSGVVCGSIMPMVVQHACHFMDATVFNIFYDEGFGNGAISSEGESCQLLQQHLPHNLRVCNPGKYAMHLRLRNETVSWDEVAKNRPTGFGHRLMDTAIDSKALTDIQEETVVNRLVRHAIEKFSESFIINQPLHVLDIGSGLGATLYSLLPLLQNDLQIRRPSRRHAKKVMLEYTGFALSTAEVVNAQVLAEQNLGDLVQENVVNASFRLGNFVKDSLPKEFKPGTYNVILAVESLSYPDKGHLQNMLRGIYNSLQKGGLLIIVDDVVLPKDPNDPDLQGKQRSDIRMQLFRAAFMRPSLIRHVDWMMLFKEAGFTLLDARDLSLEYGLVPDEEDKNLPFSSSNTIIRNSVNLWRYIRESYERVMMWILMHFLTTAENEHGTVFYKRMQSWLRLLLLQRGTFALQRGYALRKEAFRTAELGYNMYILKR